MHYPGTGSRSTTPERLLSQAGRLSCLNGMHSQRILIIGGGFAGVNAAAGAVETLGQAQERVSVELISPDPYWAAGSLC
jgi:hypothetical protein